VWYIYRPLPRSKPNQIYIPHTILPLTYFIHLTMKMEPIVSSETSAIRTQTPGNYPKRNNLKFNNFQIFPFRITSHFLFKFLVEIFNYGRFSVGTVLLSLSPLIFRISYVTSVVSHLIFFCRDLFRLCLSQVTSPASVKNIDRRY